MMSSLAYDSVMLSWKYANSDSLTSTKGILAPIFTYWKGL